MEGWKVVIMIIKKDIVKFEEGMCSFLGGGSGVGKDKYLPLF
jgi:hypothetical protein